ncbi:Ran GAP Rna1, partial [Conglomerata obtusa]
MIFSLAGEKKRYETADSVKDHIKTLKENQDTIIEINLQDNVFLQPALFPLFKQVLLLKNLRKIILSRIFSALPKETMMECFKIILENINAENLYVLDLSQNAISCEFPEFFTNFISRLDNLKVFKIYNCGLGTTGGKNLAHALSKIKNKKNLISIDVSTNKLVSSARELGETLADFENLEEIFIQYNNIDRESMFEFLKSFEMHMLGKLDLRDNFIDVEGCKLLGEYFVTWDLEELKMSDCLIGDSGVKAFIGNAREKKRLTMHQGGFFIDGGIELDLGFNAITQKGLKDLEDFVEDVNVTILRIEGNDFSECSSLIECAAKKGGIVIYEEEDSEEEIKEKENLEEDLINM